jgi:ubiquinol-cytochrome c reductase cytochrome b subunit
MGLLKSLWGWVDDRTGLSALLGDPLFHPVPRGAGWDYVFGSAALFAFIVQVITGIALATAFVTSPADAYDSLIFITNDPFGYMLRGMHFYGASAMMLMVGLHMLQVYLYGAYKFPREMQWLSGVVLFAVTVGLAFTGQLLRWDDIAVWSVFLAATMADRVPLIGDQIGRFILAGETVGGQTLSRFYAIHVFFIPAVVFVFLGLHIWLILHNGISEPPVPGQKVDPKTYRDWYHKYLERDGVPFWPDAAWRDIVFGVGMVVVIMLLAWFWGPPHIGAPPDPSVVEAYPRPDWYFLWMFAGLALIPPALEEYLLVIGPLLIGGVLIALPFISNRGERSPWTRPWAVAISIMIVLMIGTLWIAGIRAPWAPAFEVARVSPDVVPVADEQVERGAQLFYDRGCQFCHSVGGQPGGARGPDLTTVGQRLTTEYITISILNGRRNMPAYAGSLNPEEVNALVAFLESLSERPNTETSSLSETGDGAND